MKAKKFKIKKSGQLWYKKIKRLCILVKGDWNRKNFKMKGYESNKRLVWYIKFLNLTVQK